MVIAFSKLRPTPTTQVSRTSLCRQTLWKLQSSLFPILCPFISPFTGNWIPSCRFYQRFTSYRGRASVGRLAATYPAAPTGKWKCGQRIHDSSSESSSRLQRRSNLFEQMQTAYFHSLGPPSLQAWPKKRTSLLVATFGREMAKGTRQEEYAAVRKAPHNAKVTTERQDVNVALREHGKRDVQLVDS